MRALSGETREIGQTVTHVVIFESREFYSTDEEKIRALPFFGLGKLKQRKYPIPTPQLYH